MPQIVNGCGTWYYGKKNVQQYQGICRACNHLTTLTSYDTRLFVVVFMIPVIPLGRKRIIEQCGACKRHHVMALADWQRAERRAQEAIAAFRASPTNTQLAEEALVACVGFRHLPLFLEFAPELEKHMAGDAKTLIRLAGAHELFGRLPDSERLLMAALAIEDTDETRELIGDCLLRQEKPEEAEPYLQHIVQDGIPDRVDLLYQLAQRYQAKGDHGKALVIFDQCEAVNPQIAQDATFARLREASQQRLGTTVALKPGEVARKVKSSAQLHKFLHRAPVALALAALAYAALAWFQGTRRQIHIVSGLDSPYTARINGKSYSIPAHDVITARVPEGRLTVEIVDPPLPVAAETVTLHSPFFTRPFANRTFVVNPDGTAILRRVRQYYKSKSTARSAPEPEVSLFAGQTLHEFAGIDYAFKDFPQSITVESHSGDVSRDGLYLAGGEEQLSPGVLVMMLAHHLGNDVAVRLAQRHLLMEPDKTIYMGILQKIMKPPEVTEFLRIGLQKRPLLLEWHRGYQSVQKGAEREAQLEREYADMLSREPQNKDLMYLAGRTTRDLDKALALYRQAASGEASCAYADFALCGYHLSVGEFNEACQYAEPAINRLGSELGIRRYCMQAFLAAEKYDRILAQLQSEEKTPLPGCASAYAEEAYVYTLQGKTAEVRDTIQRLGNRLNDFDEDFSKQQVLKVQANLAYAAGNAGKFAQLLQGSSDAEDRFAGRVSTSDLTAAEAELKTVEPDAQLHLMLYLAAAGRNEREIAERHLKSAVELLAKGDDESRTFGSVLKGGATVDTKDLLRLREQPGRKAVLLTAIGVREPARREACFALAKKLNFDKRFPHLLLKSVTDGVPNPGAPGPLGAPSQPAR